LNKIKQSDKSFGKAVGCGVNSPNPGFEVGCNSPYRTLSSRDNRPCQTRFPRADCL